MIRFVAATVCDRLFEEHQELLNLFTKFHKLKTRDEQASSEELAEHAVSVMTTLDESIRSLDNVDAFILYLHQVGQSHYKIPGFQKEYFWVCLYKTKFSYSILSGQFI
jgi:hemoglobin-like flavoprotein